LSENNNRFPRWGKLRTIILPPDLRYFDKSIQNFSKIHVVQRIRKNDRIRTFCFCLCFRVYLQECADPTYSFSETQRPKLSHLLCVKPDSQLVQRSTVDGFIFLAPADFYKDFAADLPSEQAQFESRSEILTAAKVFTAPMTAAAWKTKPSWAIVAAADRIINPDLDRWYYTRAHSHAIELDGASHSVYESRPKEVAAVIEDAAQKAQN
jgi:pimeloyl-ACP methyl ester carboxylesterase